MDPKAIITQAIKKYNPSHIICLFSGGYDSMCMTHLVHSYKWDIPLLVYAIDTQLSADGWRNYVDSTAHSFGWYFDIYDSISGFKEFVKLVKKHGCPYTPGSHSAVYNRLKDRAIEQMLRDHKTYRPDKLKYKHKRYDKILFLTGIRQSESIKRSKLKSPIQRKSERSAAVFANPIFYWSEEDLLKYHVENDLPTNPFYDTVGGSGDCQCNFLNFINLETLKKHSPNLAKGNVALIDSISRQYHNYGWDEKGKNSYKQKSDTYLCSNCDRTVKDREAVDLAMLRLMF